MDTTYPIEPNRDQGQANGPYESHHRGPDELERELEKTVWRATPATEGYVFAPSEELWEEVSWHIQEETIQSMFHTRHVPKDPLVN